MRNPEESSKNPQVARHLGGRLGPSLLVGALAAPLGLLALPVGAQVVFPSVEDLSLARDGHEPPASATQFPLPSAPTRLGARRGASRAGDVQGGRVVAELSRRVALVIVDDNFAGSSFGDPVFFNDPGLGIQAGTFGFNAFATIQDAVDAVDNGGTVLVAGGNYFEQSNDFPTRALTIVNKRVSILGPNSGISASDGSARYPEARVHTALQLFNSATPVVGFFGPGCNGSVFDGLLIQGDNPGLTSGFVVNGADFDASIGLLAFQNASMTVANCIVENVEGFAIAGFYNGGFGEGSLFANNLVQNIVGIEPVDDSGVGFVAAQDFYVDIVDNAALGVRTGIQTNFLETAASRTYVISGNEIEASHRGIYWNYHEDFATDWDILGNTISARTQDEYLAATLPYEGIRVETIFASVAGLIAGNTLDASAALADPRYTLGVTGINVLGSVSPNIVLDSNTLTNHRRGILLQANIPLVVSNHPQVSNNTQTGVEARNGQIILTGSGLSGNEIGILADGGQITASGNLISGGGFGAVVRNSGLVDLCDNVFSSLATWNIDVGATANAALQGVKGSTFDGTGDGVRNQGAGTLDAIGNYWGSPLGPNTIASNSTSGAVDFIPFQLAPGSPAIGPCQGDVTLVCEDLNGANYTLPSVLVGDTCDGTPADVVVTYEIPDLGLSGLSEGEVVLFPIGTTEVTLVATDPNGPPAVCVFLVEVLDDVLEPGRFASIPAQDGYIQESSQGSGVGQLARGNLTEARIGDDAQNRQWKSVFGFDTSDLPEGRTVTSARIRLTVTSQFGNPATLGQLVTDMAVPSFGAAGLVASDFEEPADFLGVNLLTPLPPAGAKTLYIELNATALAQLETADEVQFRVQFADGTNADGISDGLRFGTGEYGLNHPFTPELIVEYDIDQCDGCGVNGVDSGNASANVTTTLVSIALDDGYLIESEEDASVGNTANSTSNVLLIGDSATRQQYIGLLSFNTAAIPADAHIVSAELSLTAFTTRNNPGTLGDLVVDMRCPNKGSIYGPTSRAETPDFQTFSHLAEVANLGAAPANGGDSVSGFLGQAGINALNKGGLTQFKVRFEQEDNNDNFADYVSFFSGNEPAAVMMRPTLTVVWRPAP